MREKTRRLILIALLVSILPTLFTMQPVSGAANTYTAEISASNTDGQLNEEDAVYATAHDDATADSKDQGNYLGQSLNGLYSIWRNYLYFDTSSLPDECAIVQANLTLYIFSDQSLTDFNVTIQNGQPTYPTYPLQTSDYDYTKYSGNGGYFDTADYAGSGWYAINITETSWINKAGTTKLCLRSSRDINSDVPTGDEWIQYSHSGLSNKPKLQIKYGRQYVFKGVYDEQTGLWKAASERAVNVTAYFVGAVTETFEVNGTYSYTPDTIPEHFLFNLTDLREYWIGSTDTDDYEETIYIFEDAATAFYTLQFLDYAGILDEYRFVEAKYLVNGTMHTVEKRKSDVTKSVSMYLVTGRVYTICISNGATYTFGELLMTTDATVTLTLKGLEFPEYILMLAVRCWITRNMTSGTTITIDYEDTRQETNQVDIYIYFVENDTLAYSNSETADVFVHNWNSADNETDYWCKVIIDHETFGIMSTRQILGGLFETTPNPFSLDVLGTLDFDTAYLIPAFILLCVAGVFSALSVAVGLFATAGIAAFFAYMQWLPIHIDALIFVFALVIIFAVSQARRRVVV